MNSLLQHAYIEKPCNACGKTFRVTLLEMYMEHQVNREWESPHPCTVCSLENRQTMWAIPPELIATLHDAWEAVANAASEHEVDLRLGA